MPDFKEQVLEFRFHLSRYAYRLARDRTLAEDLVQETVLRALAHADQFQPGTHLSAWLKAILRNVYFLYLRRQRREDSLDCLESEDWPAVAADQESRVQLRDLSLCVAKLPKTLRQALLLVGAGGHGYDRAAQLAGCPLGTMKSRVSRARADLREMLSHDRPPRPSIPRGHRRPRSRPAQAGLSSTTERAERSQPLRQKTAG